MDGDEKLAGDMFVERALQREDANDSHVDSFVHFTSLPMRSHEHTYI